MADLRGRVALVMGASRDIGHGIGRGIARGLGEAGATVDVGDQQLAALVDRVSTEQGRLDTASACAPATPRPRSRHRCSSRPAAGRSCTCRRPPVRSTSRTGRTASRTPPSTAWQLPASNRPAILGRPVPPSL